MTNTQTIANASLGQKAHRVTEADLAGLSEAEGFHIDRRSAIEWEGDVHEIDVLMGVIILRARANFNWLNRNSENGADAKRSAEALLLHVRDLRNMIRQRDERI
jgi:hypothetical protein